VAKLLQRHGGSQGRTRRDLADRDRCTAACWGAPSS
jgi:hypothetical protein